MTANNESSSAIARWLFFSIAMAILGLTSGCGGVPPEATLDDAAKAQVQEAHDVQQKLREKRAAKASKGKSGRLSKGDLQN
jgi:hypothetical protein